MLSMFSGIVSSILPGKAAKRLNAAVILVIGIYDDNPANQGHKAVLEIIERIQAHYEGTPLLAGQFVFDDPFNWVLQDEQSWPYFYGACNLTFKLPAPRTKASDLV